MPVPSSIADLSTTAASNSPANSDSIGTSADDFIRTLGSIIKQENSKGSDITAAGTITIPNAGSYFVVTGNTTITAINNCWDGRVVALKFSGTPILTHSSGLILPGAANITAAAGDTCLIANETTGVWRVVTYQRASDNALSVDFQTLSASLTQFYSPANGSGYQDQYRSGWLHSWFNQQWGGAQWGMLPDGSFGSVATGNIEDNNWSGVGDSAADYYMSQGFKVSESITNPTIWLKLYKVGNPTNNLYVKIYSDNGSGSPNAQVGSDVQIAVRLVTSKTDGEWIAVTPTPGTLTAGTQYHIVCTFFGTDASNYYAWKEYSSASSRKYPHGYKNLGTSTPVWTASTGRSACFLIQNTSATSILQSGGMFDYKLAFNAGSPVNQSRSVAQPLANFYDGKSCSVLVRGSYASSSNVWDYTYGLDHDRITVTINSSGYPVLTIYESDRTVATVTGTGSITSGSHDVGIRVRTVGDGSDYATLYVDAVSVGTPLTSQTFTMDAAMARLGTARLGDGFGIIPTWTQDMQMTSLPSAQGWTWTGTGTEANAMSIQGGKLYQNANGYASTQTGYYQKTVAFSNATGWAVSWKVRINSSPNTVAGSTAVQANDGAKNISVLITEYFVATAGASTDFIIQGDFKSQEHVFTLCGKGSDYYLLIDGKLAIDGTGKLTNATANNTIIFGDFSATASENADAIWSYVKYYQGGMILPTASTSTCSEFAHWSGDKSALYPSLWNSGTPVSVKQLCGVPRNYQFEQVVQREVRTGVTASPTTTSTSPVLLTDMEMYLLGADVRGLYSAATSNSGANLNSMQTYVDGAQQNFATNNTSAGGYVFQSIQLGTKPSLGLHKVEGRWNVNAGTGTANGTTTRQLQVEARS